MTKVCIIDYEACNLASLLKAVRDCTSDVTVENRPSAINYTHYILPGVGSFPFGMSKLEQLGWIDVLKKATADGRFILGICLGMQLLASSGTEDTFTEGLNLIPGRVERLTVNPEESLPHVGWNSVEWQATNPLAQSIVQKSDFYFVHSYHFATNNKDNSLAITDYAGGFTSIVGNGKNIFGVQFHPEKSSRAGRQLIRNFISLC